MKKIIFELIILQTNVLSMLRSKWPLVRLQLCPEYPYPQDSETPNYLDKVNGQAVALALISIYLIFCREPGYPATRVHLTILNIEESSTRCSFTNIFYIGLDPRSPISIARIFNDLTIPTTISLAGLKFPFNLQLLKLQGFPGV